MKNSKIILSFLLKTPIFKLLLSLTIAFSTYTGCLFSDFYPNTIDSLLCIFATPWVFVFIFLIVILSSINVTSILENMSILKTRLHSKKDELSFITKYVVCCTIIIVSIFCLSQILFTIFLHGIVIDKTVQIGYGIPIFYCILYIIRYFIILSLFSILVASFKYKFNQYIVIILSTILVYFLWMYKYDSSTIVNSILNMKWFIGYYFTIVPYGNLFTEIYCSCFYIIFLCLLYLFIQYLFCNKHKMIDFNTLKTILLDDIIDIVKNKKKILLTFFITVTLFVWWKTSIGYVYSMDNVYLFLGLKVTKMMDPIIFLLFLLYLTLFVYFSFSIFIKDIIHRADTYFVRMKVSNWYLYKTFSMTFITLIIKAAYYIIFCLIMSRAISINGNIVYYFGLDMIFSLFLEQSFLILYFQTPKIKIIWLVFIFVLLSITGISIINFNYKVFLLLSGLIISIILMFISCDKHKKLLFERVN